MLPRAVPTVVMGMEYDKLREIILPADNKDSLMVFLDKVKDDPSDSSTKNIIFRHPSEKTVCVID